MPPEPPPMRSDSSLLAGTHKSTRLGVRLTRGGFTQKRLSSEIGVSKQDVSNFLRGRSDKIGRLARKKIRQGLGNLGILPIRTRLRIRAGYGIQGK